MKKILLSFGIVMFLTSIQNCSSDRDDKQIVTQEAQDFTNPKFIKSLMVGQWNMISFKTSQGWWMSLTANDEGYFIFKDDNTFIRKPFGAKGFNDFIESGTYTIEGATATRNASVNVKYTLAGKDVTKEYNLISFTDGVVEMSYYSPLYGISNERFKK